MIPRNIGPHDCECKHCGRDCFKGLESFGGGTVIFLLFAVLALAVYGLIKLLS